MNKNIKALASAVRHDTANSGNLLNEEGRGIVLTVNVTAVPGGGKTVTPKIQGYDATTGVYRDILVGTAMSTISSQVLEVYPGLTASPNAVVSDVLPAAWRVVMTHSSNTGDFTYAVGANLIG